MIVMMMITVVVRDKNKGVVPQIKAVIQHKLQLSAYKSDLNTGYFRQHSILYRVAQTQGILLHHKTL